LVPKERAVMAMGIFATMRVVAGEAIAIAITGAILLALSQAGLRESGSMQRRHQSSLLPWPTAWSVGISEGPRHPDRL
jgi:hypothetical protein